ncbi:hypothetical protein SAMN05216551_102516 [Chitinasiproducens palmae]|uniref:Uncharacterized protein n=1 Tax=Chitinasiproducens palmae TaxID=1770053 RepID=A0A1H2PNJ2_9BURK|nr:hypothetical protein SAMN05216551_102516 [Chitinasiproducens palmae]
MVTLLLRTAARFLPGNLHRVASYMASYMASYLASRIASHPESHPESHPARRPRSSLDNRFTSRPTGAAAVVARSHHHSRLSWTDAGDARALPLLVISLCAGVAMSPATVPVSGRRPDARDDRRLP